jgi:hypothetical protein
MTVGGCLSGDGGGDLANQPPTAARLTVDVGYSPEQTRTPSTGKICSPEKFTGSRFWVLEADDEEVSDRDDEDVDEREEDGSPAGGGDRSATYLCRTPSPVRDADLLEDSSDLNRRRLKRLRRRDEQRMAARSALFFSINEGMNSSSPLMPLGIRTKAHVVKRPVIEPSVFLDESLEGWTVVRRRRWSPASDVNLCDPRMSVNSNFRVAGQAGLRALVNNTLRSSGPNQSRQGRYDIDQSDRGPRLARVGNNTAGFAFRRF